MVAPAQREQRIASSLHAVEAELDDLPAVAAAWGELTVNQRLDYALEWDDIIGRIGRLGRDHEAGRMTPSEQGRYRRVLRTMADAKGIIAQLGLSRPKHQPE